MHISAITLTIVRRQVLLTNQGYWITRTFDISVPLSNISRYKYGHYVDKIDICTWIIYFCWSFKSDSTIQEENLDITELREEQTGFLENNSKNNVWHFFLRSKTFLIQKNDYWLKVLRTFLCTFCSFVSFPSLEKFSPTFPLKDYIWSILDAHDHWIVTVVGVFIVPRLLWHPFKIYLRLLLIHLCCRMLWNECHHLFLRLSSVPTVIQTPKALCKANAN